MTPDRILATLTGHGERMENFILLTVRLPRLLTGIAAGAAFGLAGALFQSVARNPLASPDLVGFNAGAALGAVTVITMAGGTGVAVTLGALAGGGLTAALITLFGWGRGFSVERIVLIGIGIGLTLTALADLLLVRASIFDATQAANWLTGSLNTRGWEEAVRSGIGLLVLGLPVLALSRPLTVLGLGDDAALALGLRITRVRVIALAAGVVLAALATSVAGPLPFVALVAGPLARRALGRDEPALLLSALVGAVVVTGADLVGRLAFAPMQLPAGLFTAALGAPVLIALLWRAPRRGLVRSN